MRGAELSNILGTGGATNIQQTQRATQNYAAKAGTKTYQASQAGSTKIYIIYLKLMPALGIGDASERQRLGATYAIDP